MKLLKLSEEHYIIADNLNIKIGDWITDEYSVWQWKDDSSLLGRLKVTHSTEPLEEDITYKGVVKKPVLVYWSINQLTVSEVKELLGLVDVATKAAELAYSRRIKYQDQFQDGVCSGLEEGYRIGYNQALEDNKEKKYTEEDIVLAFTHCAKYAAKCISTNEEADFYIECEKYLSSIQHSTEWDVEIIDGKLKLK